MDRILTLIKRFEGCELLPYQDVGGIWTCGWGSTGIDVVPGVPWTQEYAEQRLKRDVTKFIIAVRRGCHDLNGSRLDAVICFVYNVGISAFNMSTMRRLILAGKAYSAADEFLKWVYVKKKVVRGLVIRRTIERSVFLQDGL